MILFVHPASYFMHISTKTIKKYAHLLKNIMRILKILSIFEPKFIL